jgi:hypothetical protein
MKKYLFRIFDIAEDNTKLYYIQANDKEEAKKIFTKKCVPLCYETFNYSDMVRMFADVEINIECYDEDEIIEL